jgi:hypothetical protein
MFLAAQMTSSSFEGEGVQNPNWEEGQSTVEAAVLLPTVFVLLALLVQPVCLLYTRTLMHGAAAETARAVLTARGSADLSACRHYALRDSPPCLMCRFFMWVERTIGRLRCSRAAELR